MDPKTAGGQSQDWMSSPHIGCGMHDMCRSFPGVGTPHIDLVHTRCLCRRHKVVKRRRIPAIVQLRCILMPPVSQANTSNLSETTDLFEDEGSTIDAPCPPSRCVLATVDCLCTYGCSVAPTPNATRPGPPTMRERFAIVYSCSNQCQKTTQRIREVEGKKKRERLKSAPAAS